MASPATPQPNNRRRPWRGTSEPWFVKASLTIVALIYLTLFLIVPLVSVFYEALHAGLHTYLEALKDPDVVSSIKLTLLTAAVAVPLNVIFGVAAAWSITKFSFFGKNLLITLIDLPFAISPVIAGMVFVLLFGRNGVFGQYLESHDIQIIFAVPGIIIATLFVTFPFVARELIPVMEAQGTEEEQAAIVHGATGWQTFVKISLPNIKWGLLYGIILTNARAMGEFGAVSVVSGHIEGMTNTMPLQIEMLYNDYDFVGAFTVASLLSLLAIVTLVVKSLVEWQNDRQHRIELKALQEDAAPAAARA